MRILRPADRPAGLISWYRAENNLLDDIGTNHGTLFGTTSYRPGKVGTAFSIPGSSGVVIPDSPSLRPTSVTFETWVNFTTTGGLQTIAGKPYGTGIQNSWAIFLNSGALNGGFFNGSSFQSLGITMNPEPGRWYHVAYTFDAVALQQRLYIDGVRMVRQAIAAPLFYDTSPTLLGRDTENSSPVYFFNGALDEAAIYNRGLSDSEIAGIYAAGVAGKALPGLGDVEDLDGDQFTNLVEYGVNTNPGISSAGPLLTTTTDSYGGTHAVIPVLRDPRKTDVTLTVESSGDLRDWVVIATSTRGGPFTGIATILGEVAGSAPRTVTIIDPYYGNLGFLRLRAAR